MNNYMEIKEIIDEYIKLMDKLIGFEQEKLKAVETKNIEHLDSFLNEEQVYLLQLRGLDQKRETILKKSGMEGLTYRQIINGIDSSQSSVRSELENSFEILSVKTNQFKEIINTIKTYIDLRLHTIEAFMERFGAPPSQDAGTGIYDKIAGQSNTNNASRFKSTKV